MSRGTVSRYSLPWSGKARIGPGSIYSERDRAKAAPRVESDSLAAASLLISSVFVRGADGEI